MSKSRNTKETLSVYLFSRELKKLNVDERKELEI